MRTAIILGLCFVLFFSCAENKKDTYEKSGINLVRKIANEKIKYKIELLSLKYNISSVNFKQEFIAYIKNQDSTIRIREALKQNRTDPDKLIEILTESRKLDIDKLTTMSERHNIPMNTIACILYDYEIWETAENCMNP